ncbi:MAG: hypothetical protein A2885_01220 [Sphingopyxis sp. RIFCSPHIGHO2_01_FULL_65_24]|nr:MAG: hypothetical protein A2885_01220 [Sphingopyxis sp. RIFCSPHIGHO2_01_FULL_65_24]
MMRHRLSAMGVPEYLRLASRIYISEPFAIADITILIQDVIYDRGDARGVSVHFENLAELPEHPEQQ